MFVSKVFGGHLLAFQNKNLGERRWEHSLKHGHLLEFLWDLTNFGLECQVIFILVSLCLL